MSSDPQIGIWWDNGSQIVAFPHQPGEPDPSTGLCDSDDAHNDLWPDAEMQLGLTDFEEYFSVPRGRVLWSPAKQISIIYHGNATTPDRLKEIGQEFRLGEWESRSHNLSSKTFALVDHRRQAQPFKVMLDQYGLFGFAFGVHGRNS